MSRKEETSWPDGGGSQFIRLRQNTLQLAAGMNGKVNAPKLARRLTGKRRRVGFDEFRFDTPFRPGGTAGSFI